MDQSQLEKLKQDLAAAPVHCDPRLHATPGYFEEVIRVVLYVPVEVQSAFIALGVQPTTAGFLALLHHQTAEFAVAIGWTVEQVVEARGLLIAHLRGFVPDEELDPGYLPGGGLTDNDEDALNRRIMAALTPEQCEQLDQQARGEPVETVMVALEPDPASQTEQLNEVRRRYRGLNWVLAISTEDYETVLALGPDGAAVVAQAESTGREYVLAKSVPASGPPLDVGMALNEVRPFVRILEDASLQARPGDFGAKLEERTLHLAPATVAALVNHQVRSAEDVLSFIHSFPTAVGVAMGWHIEDVIRARDTLCSLLRGVVSAGYTDPPPPPQFAMGAMAPDWVIQQTQAAAEQTPKTAYWIAVKSEARDQAPGDWTARLRKIPGLTVEEGANPSRVRVLADATAIAIARVHFGSYCYIEEETGRGIS